MTEDLKTCTTAGIETFLQLFRVQPGIPLERALDELSMLLGCIRHLTTEAEMDGDLLAGSAARVLSCMAKALINDLEVGLPRDSAGLAVRRYLSFLPVANDREPRQHGLNPQGAQTMSHEQQMREASSNQFFYQ